MFTSGLNSALVRHVWKWPPYYNNKFKVRFKIQNGALFTSNQ